MSQELSRITGTEMEWGIVSKTNAQDSSWEIFDPLNYHLDYLPRGLYNLKSFLSNGGRYYIDYGEHIEYCTPEDSSYWNTVINEIAGERILLYTLDSLIEKEFIIDYRARKSLVDDIGNSWGHHESYLCAANKININEDSLQLLGLHMATRNVWAGAGNFLGLNKRKIDFEVSARAARLDMDYENQTTVHKPVINLRNESLSDVVWNRVHVTSGDANTSPWAMWMSLATTSIVLKLIEEGHSSINIELNDDLYKLAHQVGKDVDLQSIIGVNDSQKIKPIDIQKSLLALALAVDTQKDIFNEEEKLALSEWQKVLDDLEFKPKIELIDRVEWIARLCALEAQLDKQPNTKDNDLLKLDRTWDDIGLTGIASRTRASIWRKWMPSEEKIEKAITNPPSTTRAKLRGEFVLNYMTNKHNQTIRAIDWNHIEYKKKNINLFDPYRVK